MLRGALPRSGRARTPDTRGATASRQSPGAPRRVAAQLQGTSEPAARRVVIALRLQCPDQHLRLRACARESCSVAVIATLRSAVRIASSTRRPLHAPGSEQDSASVPVPAAASWPPLESPAHGSAGPPPRCSTIHRRPATGCAARGQDWDACAEPVLSSFHRKRRQPSRFFRRALAVGDERLTTRSVATISRATVRRSPGARRSACSVRPAPHQRSHRYRSVMRRECRRRCFLAPGLGPVTRRRADIQTITAATETSPAGSSTRTGTRAVRTPSFTPDSWRLSLPSPAMRPAIHQRARPASASPMVAGTVRRVV